MRALLLLLAFVVTAALAAPEATSPGEAIYRFGQLPGGGPLRGERELGVTIEGAAAACVACHRRSGLGASEGNIVIPPITWKYLYRPDGRRLEDIDLQYARGNISLRRNGYSDETLARAIREGVGRDGRKLNALMPRFALDDAAMASLVAYLKGLGRAAVPGVAEDTLHFATIITPDADPVAKRGMLDVLERFFADKNEFIRGGHRRMEDYKEINFRVVRRWRLHVWELSGPPETWEQQLHARLAAEPVFAVISGLGGKTWAPVHRFCEAEAIPCLFPNVDLPVVAEGDFYSVYFSRGVQLEADLMFDAIKASSEAGTGVHRIVQVFRRDDIGAAAAAALRTKATNAGLEILDKPIASGASDKTLGETLSGIGQGDTLVLWLRPHDVALLPPEPPAARQIMVSGLMGGMDDTPLPAEWRRVSLMSYPVDLPEQRQFRTNFPHAWFRIRHIPVVADRVQSDTYLACGILAETLTDMLDSFVRDYLVERIETMLSWRTLTGYYPRLGLAPGQRFASKGGYMVGLPEAGNAHLVARGGWRVP